MKFIKNTYFLVYKISIFNTVVPIINGYDCNIVFLKSAIIEFNISLFNLGIE